MNPIVARFLTDLHGDMRVLQDRLRTFLMEHHMALDPQVEAKLSQVSDTIATEVQQIRDLLAAGTDPTELLGRLDNVISSIQSISDQAQQPPTQPPGE